MTKTKKPYSYRKKLAVIVTAFLAVCLFLPLGLAVYWYSGASGTSQDMSWTVPEFLLNDKAGMPMTRFDLETRVTVVASFADRCVQACEAELRNAREVAAWIEDRLIYEDGGEVSPIRLVAMGRQLPELGERWRLIEADDSELGRAFIPPRYDAREPALIVIDQTGQVRLRRLLAEAGLVDELKPFLSKLIIHHYMEDYLAKRTFFRRTPKEGS